MKKKVTIIVDVIIFLIIATLVGTSIVFVGKYDTLQDDKKVISKEVDSLNKDLTEINDELSKLTKEIRTIKNEIDSAKTENENAKQTIAANAWDILQIGDAATKKINEVKNNYQEAGLKFEYGHISHDDYINTLTQAMQEIKGYNDLIERATELGKKYEPYITDSIKNNTPELPSENLTKQMNSLEKENNDLIKKINKNNTDIKKYEKEYNTISKKNESKISEVNKQKDKLEKELKTTKERFDIINKKLKSFPYNFISTFKNKK